MGKIEDLLQNCSAAPGQNVNIKPAFVSISPLSFLPSLFVLLMGKTDLTDGGFVIRSVLTVVWLLVGYEELP